MSEPYINAVDYGVPSVFDDVAMQAALDAVDAQDGGTVVVPKGVWTFATYCIIRQPNTRITGYGAVIRPDASGLPLFYNYTPGSMPAGYTGVGDIVIEGLTFDMQGQTNQIAHNVITMAHAAGITFRDCTFLNVSSYHALEFHSVKGALVDNCKFHGWKNWLGTSYDYREAIQLDSNGLTGDDGTPCLDITIQNCDFGASAECGGWGTALGSHTIPLTVHRNIKFLNNSVEDCLVYGVKALSWSDVIINGNRFDSVAGNAVHVGCETGLIATRVSISDNLISWSGVSGVRIEAETDTRYTQVMLQDNEITNSGSNAVLISDVDRGIVSGNQIRTTDLFYGFQLGVGSAATVNDLLVTGNHITNTASAGIRLNYALNCYVVGNRVQGGFSATGSTSTKTTLAGAYSLPGDNLI